MKDAVVLLFQHAGALCILTCLWKLMTRIVLWGHYLNLEVV